MELGILNKYIQMFNHPALAKQVKLINEISKLYLQAFADTTERERYAFELGYLLSGQIVLHINGKSFYSVRELREHMLQLHAISFETLRKFCQKLFNKQQELIPQFEVWLLAMGKGKEVRAWRREISGIREEDTV